MEKEMMDMPERKLIDHRGPRGVDVRDAWYFITLCAEERCNYGRAVVPPTAECVECPNTPFIVHANEILECARYYHTHGKWHLALFLIMPDHIHFIVHVPSNPAVGGTTALPTGANPAVGGTTALPDWPYVIAFDRESGEERIHL